MRGITISAWKEALPGKEETRVQKDLRYSQVLSNLDETVVHKRKDYCSNVMCHFRFCPLFVSLSLCLCLSVCLSVSLSLSISLSLSLLKLFQSSFILLFCSSLFSLLSRFAFSPISFHP